MTNKEARSVIEGLLTNMVGDFADKEMPKDAKRTFDALEKAKEALEKAETYKKVVITNPNGEEFSVLVDKKRFLVYSACVPLAFYKATGLVDIGEEGEKE